MPEQLTIDRPGAEAQRSKQREQLLQEAERRVRQGLAPPAEIYRLGHRDQIDWSNFPSWAYPIDPEVFDGCCHEG